MKQLELINPENATKDEADSYDIREAARAIVLDDDGNIAMLHVTNKNHYKLPGGGIDEGEDKIAALKRECLEEIGCNVEVLNEIGEIIEYRKTFKLKQMSYCYLAKVVGEKGKPDFTEHELSHGFEQVWLPYDEALEKLSENKATHIIGKLYIVPRDIVVLKEAKIYLDKIK